MSYAQSTSTVVSGRCWRVWLWRRAWSLSAWRPVFEWVFIFFFCAVFQICYSLTKARGPSSWRPLQSNTPRPPPTGGLPPTSLRPWTGNGREAPRQWSESCLYDDVFMSLSCFVLSLWWLSSFYDDCLVFIMMSCFVLSLWFSCLYNDCLYDDCECLVMSLWLSWRYDDYHVLFLWWLSFLVFMMIVWSGLFLSLWFLVLSLCCLSCLYGACLYLLWLSCIYDDCLVLSLWWLSCHVLSLSWLSCLVLSSLRLSCLVWSGLAMS